MSQRITEYDLFSEIMESTKKASSYTDPNMSLLYSVGCLVWGWRHEYIKEPTGYYIPSKAIKSMKTALKEYKGQIITGEYSKEATAQIERAERWIDKALSHRVRLPQGKPRVF